MRENVKIITDKDGRKLVVISKILFKGKRSICWDEVKKYLRQYVGNSYLIEDTMIQFILDGIYRMNIRDRNILFL